MKILLTKMYQELNHKLKVFNQNYQLIINKILKKFNRNLLKKKKVLKKKLKELLKKIIQMNY